VSFLSAGRGGGRRRRRVSFYTREKSLHQGEGGRRSRHYYSKGGGRGEHLFSSIKGKGREKSLFKNLFRAIIFTPTKKKAWPFCFKGGESLTKRVMQRVNPGFEGKKEEARAALPQKRTVTRF